MPMWPDDDLDLRTSERSVSSPSDRERLAYVGERSLTFGRAHTRARAIAHALGDAGLRPGETVALVTSHRVSLYTSVAACFLAGFPVAILDPEAASGELDRMLATAAPSAIIADDQVLTKLADGSAALPPNVWRTFPSARATSSQTAETGPSSTTSDHPLLDEIEAPNAASAPFSGGPDLPAYMVFTSGTTSSPKAVVVSRHALRQHVSTLSKVFDYDRDARLLLYLPSHHTDGMVHGIYTSLFTGMPVIHPGAFTPTVDLEKTLRAHRITHFLAVPAMLSIIKHRYRDRPDLFGYDEFRTLISTAGLLDEPLWAEFEALFDVRISNIYGLTETVSGSLFCGPGDESYRIGTLGKPVDAEVRIVDNAGVVLPPGKVGELQISGEHLMSGYLGDPGASGATINDGWLSTGDHFVEDADGFFHIVGRKKNIINRGGAIVYPEDIRRALVKMPGLLEVEVIGLPDPLFEEIIVVCAVVESGIDVETIRAHCVRELAPERRPDRVVLLAELPRGPSGKVQRDALIAALDSDDVQAATSARPIRDRVIELASGIFDVSVTSLDEASSPDTVDVWDSYAAMEFVLGLEREFSLRLSADDFTRIDSIGRAIEVVEERIRDGGENQ